MFNRVLLLYTNMNVGGAQRHIIDLAKGLKSKNKEVWIGSNGGNLESELKSNNISHIRLISISKNPFKLLNSVYSIIKFISENNIDIIHSHSRFTNFLFFCAKRFIKRNSAFISTAHNVFPNLHKFGFWAKDTICVSSPVKEYISSVSNTNSIVIHNSINCIKSDIIKNDLKNKLGIPKYAILLINIGRLTEQKFQINILNAIKILEKDKSAINEYFVVIVGDGPKKTQLIENIQINNINNRVKLIGERDDIQDLLSISDIFILSSKWEGLPLTILEASSYSLPIVSMDVGGVSDFITDGENGFLVSPDDIQNFSLYMKRLINDEDLRHRMGHQAKNTFKIKFSMNDFIGNTMGTYQRVYSRINNG